MKLHITLLFLSVFLGLSAQDVKKLTGVNKVWDAGSSQESANKAFDNNIEKDHGHYSNNADHGWVGLDLGTQHVIKKIRWCPAPGTCNPYTEIYGWVGLPNRELTTSDVPYSNLGVFEGANRPDFSDAVPLYLITSQSTTNVWEETSVNVSRGFRYVRYAAPKGSNGRIREIEFYGYAGEGDDSQFYQPTNLPVVVVHTSETRDANNNLVAAAGTDPFEDKTTDLNATFTFLSQDGGKIMTEAGTFRERGNSSRNFPKRPYRIKLDKKQKVFAAKGKYKKWTLVPAIDDQSLMRNIIGYGINEKLGQEYTPYIRPVDVFVNGEYKGQYQFCDQVELNADKDSGTARIDAEEIKQDKSGNWPGSAYDFGWFLEIDAQASSEPWHFDSKTPVMPVTIKSPEEDGVSQSQKNTYIATIKSHFDAMIDATNAGKVEQYLDLPSFARHFIGVEFVGNTDGYRSLYLHKHKNDNHFYAGPLWDLNLTFNNDRRLNGGNMNAFKKWSFAEPSSTEWVNAGAIRDWLLPLVSEQKNPQVMQEIKDVWASVRASGVMNKEVLTAEVDALKDKLDASQKINFLRWRNLGFRFFYQPKAVGSWEAEVANLRNCLENRVAWMDGMLGTEPKTESVTISAAGRSTIFLPMAFVVPEGLECYEIIGVEEGRLVFNQVTSTEANKPYLLKGEQGTYTLHGYSSPARNQNTLGLLTGTGVKIDAAPVGSYVLQNQNGQVFFYKVYPGTKIPVGAKRAYLTMPESLNGAPERIYLDGEEEGLQEMASEFNAPVRIYDIAGHLLEEITSAVWSDDEVLGKYGRGMYLIHSGNTTRKVAYGY